MTNFLCFLHKRRIDRSWQQGVATLADDIGAAFFVGSILWNMFFGISKVLEWCLSDTSQRNSILHLYRLPVPDLGAVRVGYGERGGLEWPFFLFALRSQKYASRMYLTDIGYVHGWVEGNSSRD
jgi:hypothetical protein